MTRLVRLFLLVLLIPTGTCAGERPPQAAIASAHPLATAAGHEILDRGGNAFDAAVAVGAMLAVVEPAGSGLGGGGFWLLHRARDRRDVVVDARERAPLKASADMYLGPDGRVQPRASLDGPLAAGIPGTPAALAHIARRYGRLPLADSLAPAIRIAEQGFTVSPHYRRLAQHRLPVLAASPAAAEIFLDAGKVPALGTLIRQPALARTLKALAAQGEAGFYAGPVAQRLVAGVVAAGGIWSERDLAEYRIVEREPLRGDFHGVRITTVPPPSAGGVVMLQILELLEAYPLNHLDPARRHHLVIEAMRLGYRERSRLGDTDHVDIRLERLLSPGYIAGQRREIRHRATPSVQMPAPAAEAVNTTHLSILDREGNRVAATLTINGPFGSGFVPPDTGVLLNNEMDDFVAQPGVPNLYGLVGSAANAIAPGKRPLSSMTPAFLETDERIAIVGTPGGSRIISMVLLATLDFAGGRGGVRDWVARPRFHHQYLPDVVEYEPGALSPAELRRLGRLGHTFKRVEAGYGNMQAVLWDKAADRVTAAADPRGEGAAQVR